MPAEDVSRLSPPPGRALEASWTIPPQDCFCTGLRPKGIVFWILPGFLRAGSGMIGRHSRICGSVRELAVGLSFAYSLPP